MPAVRHNQKARQHHQKWFANTAGQSCAGGEEGLPGMLMNIIMSVFVI